ncbi:MAG: hypothetical protein WB524_14615 [Acidobacteriaceae bacterium]
MSWCDKLASVPTVGFSLDWHFASANTILEALSPTLDHMVREEKPQFTVANLDQFTVAIRGNDGFQYGVEPSKASVGFNHSVRTKAVSSGPPVLEMLSHAMPYTQLLDTVFEKLVTITLAVPDNRTRKVTKMGIVSSTQVHPDEAPPGIRRFIEYVGRPWQGFLHAYSFQIVTELGQSPAGSDRCVHTLAKAEDERELLSLSFDWQRTLTPSRPINKDVLGDIIKRARFDALKYFEDLAEGGRFDVDDGSTQD